MLTNDFRAVSFIRSYGVPKCTTIESVWDIDMVAPQGADHLVIDTPEDDAGKLEEYVELFDKVTRVTDCTDTKSRYGEEVLTADVMVDNFFIEAKAKPKIDRIVLFFGDSDPLKQILKNIDRISALQCDLLLGEYFFLGYEDEIKDGFGMIYESDEYMDIISGSRKVIAYSLQCALEANASGADTVYINDRLHDCQIDMLKELGISSYESLDDIDVE